MPFNAGGTFSLCPLAFFLRLEAQSGVVCLALNTFDFGLKIGLEVPILLAREAP